MKNWRPLFWFGAVLFTLLLFVLAVRSSKKPTEQPPSAVTTENSTPLPSAKGSATGATRPAAGTALTNTPAATVVGDLLPPESVKPKSERMREGLAALNDDDVVLYGRVLDQYGAPVANATVSGIIQVNNGLRVGTDRMSTATDGNGLFTISGHRGKNLGINVAKPGYVLATTNTSFVYSHLWPETQRHVPDPSRPATIQMWRLRGAEPLVDISRTYRLPFTGTPLLLDLLKGMAVNSGGDLQLIVTRASGSLAKSPGDWSAQFVPVNGGIIESEYHTSGVTFEAPADGYRDSYLIEMRHDDPAWADGVSKTFFLKSRGGQVYSKLYVVFGINREPNDKIYMEIRGVANTNSSRNWETSAP